MLCLFVRLTTQTPKGCVVGPGQKETRKEGFVFVCNSHPKGGFGLFASTYTATQLGVRLVCFILTHITAQEGVWFDVTVN